jgi:hypothetical protein
LENAFVISLKNTKNGTIAHILLPYRMYVAAVYYRAKCHSAVGYSMPHWAIIVQKLPHHITFESLPKKLWMNHKLWFK